MKKNNVFIVIFFMVLALCSSEASELKGPWTDENKTIEFFIDNTWVIKGGVDDGISGKWRVMEDGRIKMETTVSGSQRICLGELNSGNLIFSGFLKGSFYNVNDTVDKFLKEAEKNFGGAKKQAFLTKFLKMNQKEREDAGNNYFKFLNKSACSQCETDAHTIASAIADFYEDPQNFRMVKKEDLNINITNPYTISGDPNTGITIQVKDKSGKCPRDYQNRHQNWKNGIYTKSFNR
ncbi:MAG: hypothetical protein ACOC2M_04290 [bacterium]